MDPTSKLKAQRELINHVNHLIQEGRLRAGSKALHDYMSAVLPDYPVRFMVIVRDLNQEEIEKYVQKGKQEGAPTPLVITEGKLYSEEKILGTLENQDSELMQSISALEGLYTIKPIELKYDEKENSRALYLALEVRRPELYFDPDGVLYSAEINSALDQAAEAPPVPLARHLEKLARESED